MGRAEAFALHMSLKTESEAALCRWLSAGFLATLGATASLAQGTSAGDFARTTEGLPPILVAIMAQPKPGCLRTAGTDGSFAAHYLPQPRLAPPAPRPWPEGLQI